MVPPIQKSHRIGSRVTRLVYDVVPRILNRIQFWLFFQILFIFDESIRQKRCVTAPSIARLVDPAARSWGYALENRSCRSSHGQKPQVARSRYFANLRNPAHSPNFVRHNPRRQPHSALFQRLAPACHTRQTLRAVRDEPVLPHRLGSQQVFPTLHEAL